MRPGTTDHLIFTEVFVGRSYSPALPFLRKAKAILDIGGNVGFFAEWARGQNHSAKIHIFEPLSGNADRCVLDSNMILHRAAVSDYNGTLAVSVEPSANYGSGHIGADRFFACDPHPPIQVVDASELFSLCGAEVFDVVKLDCEGAELGILRRLDLKRVRCVIFEYHKTEEIPLLTEVLTQKQFEIRSADHYHRVIYAVNKVQPPV
jgi:FkbM family methyltransferase